MVTVPKILPKFSTRNYTEPINLHPLTFLKLFARKVQKSYQMLGMFWHWAAPLVDRAYNPSAVWKVHRWVVWDCLLNPSPTCLWRNSNPRSDQSTASAVIIVCNGWRWNVINLIQYVCLFSRPICQSGDGGAWESCFSSSRSDPLPYFIWRFISSVFLAGKWLCLQAQLRSLTVKQLIFLLQACAWVRLP